MGAKSCDKNSPAVFMALRCEDKGEFAPPQVFSQQVSQFHTSPYPSVIQPIECETSSFTDGP